MATIDDPFTYAMPDIVLEQFFPAPCFIRIIRLDMDRQAVSYWRAINSNVWSVGLDDSTKTDDQTSYSFEGIDRCRRAIENGELCWDRLIRDRKSEALVITYEELASAFTKTIERAADYICPGALVSVPSPKTRILSDDKSLEMLERFRAERAARR